MCNPASFVIVKESGGLRVLWDKTISESHEDIISHFSLSEQNVRGDFTFMRVEIVPPDGDFTAPLDAWVFHRDQDVLPVWWDAAAAERAVRAELPAWLAAKAILPGQSRAVYGHDYIVYAAGVIEYVSDSAVIKYVGGSAVIKNVRGSAVIIAHVPLDPSIIRSVNAVIIDRSESPPIAHIGPPTK